MKQFAANLWRRVCEVVAAYYQRVMDACTSCRDCQNTVAFLEHTCEHCGAYAPVRVPWSVGVGLGIVCALALCSITACIA